MKRNLPFQVSMTFNEVMRGWEINLQVGGFQTREEAEEAAEELAHMMTDEPKRMTSN